MVSLMVCPFVFLFFLNKNFDKLKDPVFKDKYGSLYQNIDLDTRLAIFNNFSFLFRRLIMAAAIVYMENYPGF